MEERASFFKKYAHFHVMGLSILFLITVYIGHLIDGYGFFGTEFISQIKHGKFPPVGYLSFIFLLSIMLYMTKSMFEWCRFYFSFFYGLCSLLVIGLMLTDAHSRLHYKLFVYLVAMPIVVYFVYLLMSGYLKEFFIFLVMLTSVCVSTVNSGDVVAQKVMILAFLCIINRHYYEMYARLSQH